MYKNYGDYDFFEYGVLVDDEHIENEIDILYCRPYDDNDDLYLFAACTVDITYRWIDKKGVMDYIGMSEDNFDSIQFAIGCIQYYGVENFSNIYSGHQFTRGEIEGILKHYLIASDDLYITW